MRLCNSFNTEAGIPGLVNISRQLRNTIHRKKRNCLLSEVPDLISEYYGRESFVLMPQAKNNHVSFLSLPFYVFTVLESSEDQRSYSHCSFHANMHFMTLELAMFSLVISGEQ